MSKKYYSVFTYAKKKGITSQSVYNRIKKGKVNYIEAEIGTSGKKSYIIVEEGQLPTS